MDRRNSALEIGAVVAVSALMVAVLVLGMVLVADERNIDINAVLIGGVLLVSLGFVGLCAIIWQVVRRLMD
jgi:hypothetical protein